MEEPEFHSDLKHSIIRVSHAGLTIGIAMIRKVLNSLAPSRRADSRTVSGTEVSINCFIRYRPIVVAIEGTIMER